MELERVVIIRVYEKYKDDYDETMVKIMLDVSLLVAVRCRCSRWLLCWLLRTHSK